MLAYVPILFDGHVLFSPRKDERVEAPGWDGRCRRCMTDRLDCMTALDHGPLTSGFLRAIVGLRFLGQQAVGRVLAIIFRRDSNFLLVFGC
jgi:hypothetical protein